MKILFVTEFFPSGKDLRFTGGVEARTYFVAKHLAKKHQVSIICSKNTFGPAQEELMGFTVYHVGPQRKYTATVGDLIKRVKFIKDAIDIGKKLDVDIIDGSNFIAHFVAARVARSKGIPSVAWYPDVWIGSWVKNAGPLGFFGEILERLNLILGHNAYVTISKTAADKLQKKVHKKVQTIPCGVDEKEFSGKVTKNIKPTIICISRLVHYKRIVDLIWAFALLTKRNLDARLVIIGRGPEEKKLKEICQMLKITQNVQFLSNLPREKLVKILKSAHLFCLPSAVEGFGIAVIEAAATGIPYVVSEIRVFKEITKNGQGGLFFKLGNVSQLASQIEKLLTDRSLYQKKSREAQDLAKNYQWQDIAQRTESIYRSLINKN